jgi:hypothetical protein
MYIQEMGRIEALPYGAAVTAPIAFSCFGRWRCPGRNAAGACDRDGTHAGPAAAVRDAERLVQVEVRDVAAELAGRAQPHHRIHVGAVHVDLAAVAMDDLARLRDAGSKTPCVEG